MDTKTLEKFCPWARNRLMEAVDLRCRRYGLTDDARTENPADSDVVSGTVLTAAEKSQRATLYARIEECGYTHFLEEMAYTWFNRFMAIRYMELHDYLPSRVRALSCATDGSFRPDCLRVASELELPGLDKARVFDLMDAADDEGLFRLILLAQCNELSDALPEVFAHLGAADELMLPDGLLRTGENDVLYHLVSDIPEETWQYVEVLGWMYQFYNSERKDEFFKSKRKASADDLAPATQLFTPKWIVQYLVENSLGRLWMLNNPDSHLKDQMKYFIAPDDEHEDFIRINGPEDITFCDPACGSGHILSYAFELLYAMYEERAYRPSEIPELILEKNLTGFEIDERAAQIASLVLAMRAREHDRRFLKRDVTARIHVFQSVDCEGSDLPKSVAEQLEHLGEIGSLVKLTEKDLDSIHALAQEAGASLLDSKLAASLRAIEPTLNAISNRYDVVVANPPYMGSSSFNPFMSSWIKKNYPDVKSDLCTCFIERGYSLSWSRCYEAMVTMSEWILVDTFKNLRNNIIERSSIITLMHMDDMVMRIAFKTCAWVICNTHTNFNGVYLRVARASLSSEGSLETLPPEQERFSVDSNLFATIPGNAFAYWTSPAVHHAFASMSQLSRFIDVRVGLQTGDNDHFLRLWWEVSDDKVSYLTHSNNEAGGSPYKWFPFNKGGDYRRWYGNNDYLINWLHGGEEIKNFRDASGKLRSRPQNLDRSFQPSITWPNSTAGPISFRYKPSGHLFCTEGNSGFGDCETLKLIQGFGNSSVCQALSESFMPSHHYKVGDVAKLPISFPTLDAIRHRVIWIVEQQRALSQSDWDSLETSWDFKRNPLV